MGAMMELPGGWDPDTIDPDRGNPIGLVLSGVILFVAIVLVFG